MTKYAGRGPESFDHASAMEAACVMPSGDGGRVRVAGTRSNIPLSAREHAPRGRGLVGIVDSGRGHLRSISLTSLWQVLATSTNTRSPMSGTRNRGCGNLVLTAGAPARIASPVLRGLRSLPVAVEPAAVET
jgi:hypothetical protein